MTSPQITTRDIPVSQAVESHIRKKTEKLNQFYDQIISCHVVIELMQKHKHQGKLYNVRIDVQVPGKELVVTHKFDEDLYIAIRDAFSAITRRLEEHSRKRHGRVKSHESAMHGHVTRLIAAEGYGFIEGIDGNEYYFSVTNTGQQQFKRLSIGDAVGFLPMPFNDGWQAHHVIRERNHHRVAA